MRLSWIVLFAAAVAMGQESRSQEYERLASPQSPGNSGTYEADAEALVTQIARINEQLSTISDKQDTAQTEMMNFALLDLNQQTSMAEGTWVMVWASIVGTLVAAVGIIYLNRNLIAAREATNTLIQAERAIISIQKASLRLPRPNKRLDSNSRTVAMLSLGIGNGGRTPALNVNCVIHLSLLDDGVSLEPPSKDSVDHSNLLTTDYHIAVNMEAATALQPDIPIFLPSGAIDSIALGEGKAFIHGTIKYTDVFNSARSSDFGFEYHPATDHDPEGETGKIQNLAFWGTK